MEKLSGHAFTNIDKNEAVDFGGVTPMPQNFNVILFDFSVFSSIIFGFNLSSKSYLN